MLYIYTEITKYLIILFMALFLIKGIRSEVLRDGYESSSGFVIRQRIYMVIIMILAYSTMTLKTGKLDYAFFGLFVMVMLVAVLILTNMLYSYTDNILLNNMAMMINVGMPEFIRTARMNLYIWPLPCIRQISMSCLMWRIQKNSL